MPKSIFCSWGKFNSFCIVLFRNIITNSPVNSLFGSVSKNTCLLEPFEIHLNKWKCQNYCRVRKPWRVIQICYFGHFLSCKFAFLTLLALQVCVFKNNFCTQICVFGTNLNLQICVFWGQFANLLFWLFGSVITWSSFLSSWRLVVLAITKDLLTKWFQFFLIFIFNLIIYILRKLEKFFTNVTAKLNSFSIYSAAF